MVIRSIQYIYYKWRERGGVDVNYRVEHPMVYHIRHSNVSVLGFHLMLQGCSPKVSELHWMRCNPYYPC